jgi:hypothetical protein
MIKFDRSRQICMLQCPRKRYWNYEFEGRGIVRKAASVPLVTGSAAHLLSEAVAGQCTIDDAVSRGKAMLEDAFAQRGFEELNVHEAYELLQEQKALVAALLYGWWRVRKPQFDAEYSVVDIEQECNVELAPNVQLMARADMVVRRRSDGLRFVWSWKTTGWVPSNFQEVWDHDTQRLSEIIAVEHRLGVEVAGVIVEALYKGRRYEGKSTSPLLYCYKRAANPPLWDTEYSHEVKRSKEWTKVPVWDENFSGGPPDFVPSDPIKYWVNWIPEEVVAKHFYQTVPLMKDEQRMAAWVRQAVAMEARSAHASKVMELVPDMNVLDEYFPQNFMSCHSFNRNCAYLDLCFKPSMAREPLEYGYVFREPHHEGEVEDE